MAASRMFWALALGSLLVVAAVAVPAAGLLGMGHPHNGSPSAGQANRPPPGWGPPGPSYAVTFEESGLPSGAVWSVTIVPVGNHTPPAPGPLAAAAPAWQGGPTNRSSNASLGFDLRNGTYHYTIPDVLAGDELFSATPASGNLTVNGSGTSVAVAFAHAALYELSFTETGLPSGAFWSVELNGSGVGVGPGAPWFGGYVPFCQNGSGNGSTSDVVSFEVPNGTYGFSVANVTASGALYAASPANGSVTVDGANASVAVTFTAIPLYDLSFTESGLPSGTFWSVAVSNASSGWFWNGSTNATVAFVVPAGVYNFTIDNVTNCTGVLYVPNPANGTVSVDDANASVAVAFAPEAVYTLSFTESGLPAGANWSVALFGVVGPWGWNGGAVAPLWGGFGEYNNSSNATLNFTVPNGTYAFYVGNVSVGSALYVPSPTGGNVSVNGSALVVPVDFARVSLYPVSFVETGLPNGTFWSVGVNGSALGGAWNGSAGTAVNFTLPNGTYNFTVGNASTCMGGLFTPDPSNGTVTVAGATAVVDITFHAVALVNVTIVESGLPNGTAWFAILAGGGFSVSFGVSNGTNLTFSVPNGTYALHVPDVWAGGTLYAASPSCEFVTVSGSAVTVSVSFAPT